MVGICSSPARGGDCVYRSPIRAVPNLEERLGNEVLDRSALSQERHEIDWRLDRDNPVIPDEKRRVRTDALVIEKYPRRGVQVVGLAVVDRDEVAVGLGDDVGRERGEPVSY